MQTFNKAYSIFVLTRCSNRPQYRPFHIASIKKLITIHFPDWLFSKVKELLL